MASETVRANYNDVEFAAWVTDVILDEVRPYNVSRPHFRYAGKESSNVYDFPIQADPGAASSYTEGTGLTNTELTTDKASATAAPFGIMATVTDELEETSIINVLSQAAGVLGRSVAEKFETDATAFLDDFANTTGTAGVATTYATLLEAKNQLAQRDQTGSAVFILDPAQVGNVQQDIGTSGAAVLASGFQNASQTTNLAGDAGFSVGGSPVYQTSLVTATGGAVFISGVALGLYEVRPLRIEMERDASLPGTEVVATTRYGMIEIRDVAGETILI